MEKRIKVDFLKGEEVRRAPSVDKLGWIMMQLEMAPNME